MKAVYILQMGDAYKIGRAGNALSRTAALIASLPYPARVVHLIPCEQYVLIEQDLHARYAHCRMNGEWFALQEQDVRDIKALTALDFVSPLRPNVSPIWTPEKIKELRNSLKLTSTQFAAALGLCAGTVSLWEAGRRHPKYAHMERLAKLSRKPALNGAAS